MSQNEYDEFQYDPSMYSGYKPEANGNMNGAAGTQNTSYPSMQGGNDSYPAMHSGNDSYPAMQAENEDIGTKGVSKERSKQWLQTKPASGRSFGKGLMRMVVFALVFGLVAGGTFQGVNYLSGKLTGNKKQVEENVSGSSDNVVSQSSVNTDGSTSTVSYDVAEIVEKTENSIVSITTKVTTDYTYFFTYDSDQPTGAGSGIIIGKSDKQLYIATNYHVIKGADEINVGFSDGEIVKASVIGYDESQDIAAVAVDFSDMKESTTKKITIAQIGDSDSLRVGEPAIAIGNALGYGQSVTVGYISALDRTIEGSDGKYIQTDAAINPGNSGGALFNAEGKVIGINSVKYVDSRVEGMGFSIPVNKAMDIINGIINGDIKAELYIGIEGAEINKEYSQIYGFPEGVYVKKVEKDSPAEAAGMYAGDIVVEIEGKEVYTVEDVKNRIQNFNKGDTVQVVVYRAEMGKYNKVTLDVTLEAK